jgi:hypothetical protein
MGKLYGRNSKEERLASWKNCNGERQAREPEGAVSLSPMRAAPVAAESAERWCVLFLASVGEDRKRVLSHSRAYGFCIGGVYRNSCALSHSLRSEKTECGVSLALIGATHTATEFAECSCALSLTCYGRRRPKVRSLSLSRT